MTNGHSPLEKYTSHTLFEMVGKGCQRVMCESWVRDWTETATYWSPVPMSLAALLSHSAGLLNRGPWGFSPLLRAGSYCLELQQLTPNSLKFLSHRVISLFVVHLLRMSIVFAPNSTRPKSRLYSDIFDRMHLFLHRWLGRRSICYKLIPLELRLMGM